MAPLHREGSTTASLANPATSGARRRIAILAGSTGVLATRASGLIRTLTGGRHAVLVLAPEATPATVPGIAASGATIRPMPARPSGLTLFAERAEVAALAAELGDFAPHVVLVGGVANRVVALRAARRAKAERTVLLVDTMPIDADRWAKRALELADAAVFYNADQPKMLTALGHLPADLPYMMVPGAGVDLAHFAQRPLPAFGNGAVVAMIAGADGGDGALLLCEAARLLRARGSNVRCRLIAPAPLGHVGLSRDRLASYADVVEFLGPLDDTREALAACHVFAYPSAGEGMPQPILEALATGRPIVTTNTAGCRETVDERVNGCLVPPGDPAALVAGIESILKRPDLIPHLARASRAKAERRFDERAATAAMMSALGVS
jgi:glycosyltransferase involved in cell wall biosynthesis